MKRVWIQKGSESCQICNDHEVKIETVKLCWGKIALLLSRSLDSWSEQTPAFLVRPPGWERLALSRMSDRVYVCALKLRTEKWGPVVEGEKSERVSLNLYVLDILAAWFLPTVYCRNRGKTFGDLYGRRIPQIYIVLWGSWSKSMDRDHNGKP